MPRHYTKESLRAALEAYAGPLPLWAACATFEEAARFSGCPEERVREFARLRRISCVEWGGTIYVAATELGRLRKLHTLEVSFSLIRMGNLPPPSLLPYMTTPRRSARKDRHR